MIPCGSDEWTTATAELRPGVRRTVYATTCDRASCATLARAHNKAQTARIKEVDKALKITAQLAAEGAALRETERAALDTQRELLASLQTARQRLQTEHAAWVVSCSLP